MALFEPGLRVQPGVLADAHVLGQQRRRSRVSRVRMGQPRPQIQRLPALGRNAASFTGAVSILNATDLDIQSLAFWGEPLFIHSPFLLARGNSYQMSLPKLIGSPL